MSVSNPGSTYRFLLDARAAFPYADPAAKQTTLTWSQTLPAAAALSLLDGADKAAVLRYHFPRDAALSLASRLLKRYAIVRFCGVRWADSHVEQQKDIQNGKPFYPPGGIEFNVSHHGEAVVLIATTKPDVKVGIDLAMVDMDRALRTIRQEGFEKWVRIFQDVFSAQEVHNIVSTVSASAASDTAALVKGMRAFFSYWALKEAYFKMTGDALLSSLLQDLEFKNVVPPRNTSGGHDAWQFGESTKPTASLHGRAIEDTQMELAAVGENYIVATSLTSFEPLSPFQHVDVERDIISVAQ